MSHCSLIKNGFYWDPTQGTNYCCANDQDDDGNSQRQWFSLTELDKFKEYRKQEYQKSKQGWLPGCQSCKNIEETGGRSMRHNSNHMINGLLKTPENNTNFIEAVIKTSNVCNLACRMCNPSYSTKWASNLKNANADLPEHLIFGLEEINDQEFEELKQNVLTKNLRNLVFSGGEVLLSEWNQKIIEHLKENNITNIECIITTNATLKLTDSWKTSLRILRAVVMDISIDGSYETFDYIRQGHSWEKLVNIVQHYQQEVPRAVFKYNYVLQAYNFHTWERDIENIEQLIKPKHHTPGTFNVAFYPSFLSPDILPKSLFDKYNLSKVVSEHNYNENKAKQFFQQSAWMDAAYGTDVKSLNPDFFDTRYYDQDLIQEYDRAKNTRWEYDL
jgi:organic radical activating enzyme